MKIYNHEQRSDEWYEARRGVITGSRLKNIIKTRGTGRKIGFYEVLAERLTGLPSDDETPLERGVRLEPEAFEKFKETIGKDVEEVGLCISKDCPHIGVSPDGLIKNAKGKYTEAVEIKCLSTSRHLQALIEQVIPTDYKYQVVQYFIVNPDLKKLYFVFYDPRLTQKPMHWIEVHRKDIKEDIAAYLEYQTNVLQEIDDYIIELSF